ncbi:MAG: carboxypeptidase-like regulatory domain-containing protein, partial [Bacillati bacterium ANGP1]
DTFITSGPSGTINTTTATFTFTASEAGSTFLCQLDGGGFAPCTSPKSYIGLTAGPHTFRVKARDQAGNEDPTPAERSFTVSLGNQPPILNSIGNKTVQLGNTLAFTVAATDPEGGFVSFAVTPLPLPAHAAFNAQSGEFVFTPDATQVGTFTLAFLASDGVASSSETITLIVTGAQPGGVTALTGRVDDTSRNPVPNVTVALKGTILSTITDAQGQFTLTGIPATQVGRQQVVVTGFAQGYANLVAPVDLIANVTTQLPSPLTLPPIDTGTAVTVNPNVPTVVQSARLNVSVTIPPHTAKNGDGTDYTGVLTISPVPEYGRPESRPVLAW